jgi:hypothetical protein
VTKVFADTFYWVALANPDDSSYAAATAVDAGLVGVLIYTTDEVLVEFMTFYSADPSQRGRAAATVPDSDQSANPCYSAEPRVVSCRT